MTWIISALAFSFFSSLTMLVNQEFKVNGRLLSGLRGIGVGLVFMPLMFFVELPTSPLFWLFIGLEVIISTFFSQKLFEASAKYGAGATSITMVLSVAFGVVLWWIVDYRGFLELISDPLKLTGILVSLLFIAIGFYFVERKEIDKSIKQLRFMMPAVILLALIMINRKEIMEHSDFYSATVYYCTISIFGSGVINMIWYLKSKERQNDYPIRKKTLIKATIYITIASGLMIFTGNLSSLKAPNPAYVSALSLTSPIWIFLINRARNIKMYLNFKAMIILLIALASLVYFANSPIHPA